MESAKRALADLYHSNVQDIKRYSVWKNDLAKRLAAWLFTVEKRPADLTAIQVGETAIKRQTGLLTATTLAACASLRGQPQVLATGVISSAITGIIIARQAAVIAATAGASAAASAGR